MRNDHEKYVFLTGATGLLGAYLLKELLLAGKRCVVIARSGKMESAVQRIESLLARFEQGNGVLPRPVVLEGDLTKPMFGLDDTAVDWARKNCGSMIHNAASLLFQSDPKTNEPYRSNVGGTQNVLEFCERTNIREFHHVSTAYICGLRSGVCRESELDVGQAFGNVYEETKVAAEKKVRSAAFLDSVTIYRPAIITGDSRTGYTSTYHGFYAPLKIVRSFIRSEVLDGTPFLSAIGLTGQESKNFVPVDWVAEAAVRIFSTPRLHGNVYHLTPRRPVTCKMTLRVFEDALRRYIKAKGSAAETNNVIVGLNQGMVGDIFREQMEVYRSYWRNDPTFDRTNIENALPDLPCPDVNYAMLVRSAMFAIENGFGWPRPQPLVPTAWVSDSLPGFNASTPFPASAAAEKRFGLQVNGPGGGGWTLEYDDASGNVRCFTGLPESRSTLVYMNDKTFRRLRDRTMSMADAVQGGAVHVENPFPSGPPVPEFLFQLSRPAFIDGADTVVTVS